MSGGATCELVPEAAARVDWLREGLLSWFERCGRCFPWREPGRSAYEVTLAEILLQRTTAAQVAQVYRAFLERYPAWDSLARAATAELERMLRPLGLWHQKARALRRLAQSLEVRHGLVPGTRRNLERLPGIGPYTASAVLAVVYGQAEPLLDANLSRLLGRCFGLSPSLSRSSRRRLLRDKLALRLVRGERSLQVSWAALDFGALVCRPRRPLCPCCPLRSGCAYALLLEPWSRRQARCCGILVMSVTSSPLTYLLGFPASGIAGQPFSHRPSPNRTCNFRCIRLSSFQYHLLAASVLRGGVSHAAN